MSILVDKTISSPQNEIYRDLHSCLTSKGIRQAGLFLVSGHRAAADTLERFPAMARSLLLCEERHIAKITAAKEATTETDALEDLAREAKKLTKNNEPRFTTLALSKELFDTLDVFGTRAPILVLKTPKLEIADFSKAPEGLEVLCSLSDPSNVGALLRSCAAFGVSKVVLLKESANPFHPKAVRAASAATLMTKLEKGPSVLELDTVLNRNDHSGKIIALDMDGKNLSAYAWPKNARILMGEEGLGVPDSRNFERVSIQMTEQVESLNATVASSIALYSYRLKHPLT